MAELTFKVQAFSERLIKIIEANLKNEQFGVTELAHESGISHSTLHRKVKKATGQTISQFIREVRLNKARELLQHGNLTVSEIAFECGFHSVTYFSKCFHDFYGFPPGKEKKHSVKVENLVPQTTLSASKMKRWFLASVLLSVFLIIFFLAHELFNFHVLPERKSMEMTIAVLPFKNESTDPTNAYFINGIMESILNNLSNIEDLNVRSRTSVEKYRLEKKSLVKIAKELEVNYIVEGNGQKYGDEILLNIQLLDARSDLHLFSEQYRKEIRDEKDFIDLQNEIALSIVSKIRAEITTEQEKREKMPTKNKKGYLK